MRASILFIIFFGLLAVRSVGQVSELVASAYVKLEAKDYPGSITDFSEALKQQPSDTSALIGIIRAYTMSENHKEAQRIVDNAIKQYPNLPDFYLRRGILNNLRGQQRKAIPDFDKALELATGNKMVPIYVNRGISYLRDENLERALEDFNNALEINPRNASALNYKAFVNYKLNNFAESIEDYNKAIDIDSNNAMSYYNRGMAHLRSGNKAKACGDFHQSCSRGNMNACRMIMAECEGVRQE